MNQDQFKSIITCGGLFDLLTCFGNIFFNVLQYGKNNFKMDSVSIFLFSRKKNRKEGRLKADAKFHGIANSLGKKKLLFIGKKKNVP